MSHPNARSPTPFEIDDIPRLESQADWVQWYISIRRLFWDHRLDNVLEIKYRKPEREIREGSRSYEKRLDYWNKKQELARAAITWGLNERGRQLVANCETAAQMMEELKSVYEPPPEVWMST
ncbi:hypothetical protein EJ06DRAFT_533957 [Trichodelitschia bisporula]|uniref:Uncharacterized protein n=1 Tax=Trichodelitschia bisporula TaxID=703511 RepID=A0A6G1HLQ5_9PEZI|nr:hypothetical protein EJ06DRAFT_533957 [Trichodelitschia bisporula]